MMSMVRVTINPHDENLQAKEFSPVPNRGDGFLLGVRPASRALVSYYTHGGCDLA
jgi:hypothetical protein